MPACAHTMRRTRESDGATVCCDCGKVFKPQKAKASAPFVDISHVTDADGVTRRLSSTVRVF